MRTQSICLALATLLLSPFASAQWGKTNGPFGGWIECLAVGPNGPGGTILYAGVQNTVFRSTDHGAHWVAANNGLPDNCTVKGVAIGGAGLYAGSCGGVFLSTNDGIHWTPTSVGIPAQAEVFSLVVVDSFLYAGTGSDGVFRSSNAGASWTGASTGLPQEIWYDNTSHFSCVSCFTSIGTSLLVGTTHGAFRSTDNGTTWTLVSRDVSIQSFLCVPHGASGTHLFAGTDVGLFLSADVGESWSTVFDHPNISSLAAIGHTLFAGSTDYLSAGLFRSTDDGKNWSEVNDDFVRRARGAYALAVDTTSTGTETLIVGTGGNGVFASADTGQTWTSRSTGLVQLEIGSLAVTGTCIMAGHEFGMSISTDEGASWVPTGVGDAHYYAFPVLGVFGDIVLAGTSELGIFRSTDAGGTWVAVNNGIPRDSYDASRYAAIRSFASQGQDLLVATTRGIYRSTNNGGEWMGLSADVIAGPIAASNAYVFATGSLGNPVSNGVYRFSDATGWTRCSDGLPCPFDSTNAYVGAISRGGQHLFVATYLNGMYRSKNDGTHWEGANAGLPEDSTFGRLCYPSVSSIASNETDVIIATSESGEKFHRMGVGMFISQDKGESWSAFNAGLPTVDSTHFINVYCLMLSGQTILAGTSLGVWRRQMSEAGTFIEDKPTIPPRSFSLEQNFPNPFNPSTTIRYELPRISQVTLSVFDLLGREVSVLVNERKDAGYHEVKFDGSGLSSGLYFYRIEAGSFVQTRKLLLIR